MQAVKKFKVLNSSAGSGKTYNLTKEYLKLALKQDDPEAFKSILAITFTNDAAAEMKERILHTLRNFSIYQTLSEKEQVRAGNLLRQITDELNEEYAFAPKLSPEQIRERASRLFRHIIYNYTDFSVSTIDSFVNRVVSSFTKELSLPYNFQVDLDAQALLSSAVDLMLSRVNKEGDELLSETLEQYTLEKADKGSNWNNLPNELVEFAQNLLNEQVYDTVSELNNLTLDDFRNIRQQLRSYQREVESSLQALGQQAIGLIEEQGLEPKNFYYGAKGIYGFFQKCALGNGPDAEPNSYARATVAEDKWYTDKKAIEANAKIEGIKHQLLGVFSQITGLQEAQLPLYKLTQAVLPHLYKLSLLNEIRRHLQEIQLETSRIHISEFNKKIADIVLNEPVPFIYERLGQRFQHILIDEFQDTSTLQWNNLLPLIDNSLGYHNFNMVVGDAKQAIYRWRGGEMEQIIQLYRNETEKLTRNKANQLLLEERYLTLNQHLYPADLSTNYRSAAEIVHFNNAFFRHVSNTRQELQLLQNIYNSSFEQTLPEGKERSGGHVEVIFTAEGMAPPEVGGPTPGPSPVGRGAELNPPSRSESVPGSGLGGVSASGPEEENSKFSSSGSPLPTGEGQGVGPFSLRENVFTASPGTWKNQKEFARGMRKNPTEAEDKLWQALRADRLGTNFRRQHAIDRYIVDFVALDQKLIIEVDGTVHDTTDQREYDAGRSAHLTELGFRVLRCTNEEVLKQLEQVLNQIRKALTPANTPETTPAPSESFSYLENTLHLTLSLIKRAVADGYSLRDVAVLHRTNKNARLTANFLKEQGYDIISQDSLSLQFSETVNFVVALFKVYVAPNDAIAKSEALILFHKVVLKQVPGTEESLRISAVARAEETDAEGNRIDGLESFYRYFGRFNFTVPRYDSVQLSIYQSTEQLLHTFGLYHCCSDADYLFRFLDVVLEYSFTGSNNLPDFLDFWNRNKEKISINTPQNRNAITVTTIHKSKGLAYPVVIVPFCDWQLAPLPSQLIWSKVEDGQLPVQLSGSSADTLRAVVTTATSAMRGTSLEQRLTEEEEKTFIENFNMLYVAFTRPEDRLYVIARHRDFADARNQKNIGYLLHSYLLAQNQWQDGPATYVLSEGGKPQSHRQTAQPEPFLVKHATGADWTQKLRLKRHAANVFDLATLDPALEEQNKIVYALCKLHYADELDKALQELLNEGIIRQRELEQLRSHVQAFLEHEHIGQFFSREFALETGKEVIAKSGKIYKPSRVVSEKSGVLHLLEFKCGEDDPMTVDELREYALTLQQLGYIVGQKMVIYTEPLRVIRV